MPDPNVTPQPDAIATAPQIDTQNSPITGELQPPASAAPSQAPVAAAPATSAAAPVVPPITATSPNPHMHSLISRFLGAMAGPAPTIYSTTPEGKVIPAANQRPDRNFDKIGR